MQDTSAQPARRMRAIGITFMVLGALHAIWSLLNDQAFLLQLTFILGGAIVVVASTYMNGKQGDSHGT